MAEVVLFQHVQGLTDGVRAFADELRAHGHTVHTPDLFDGERLATIEDGFAHILSIWHGWVVLTLHPVTLAKNRILSAYEPRA